MTKDVRQMIEVVCFAGVMSVLCLIGIPANVINCLVFYRQGLQDRINTCLFSLALVDCAYLMCIFAVYSVSSLIWFVNTNLSEEYSTKAFVYGGGVLYGLRSTSGCINMVIAIERCVCVRFPLHVASLMRTRTMAAMMLLSFLLFQACYLVIPFSYQPLKTGTTGKGQWSFVPTTFLFQNISALHTFIYTVLGTGVSSVTLLIICVTTGVTIMTLRAAMAWRSQTSSMSNESDRQQRALTTMLLMTSCVYVITVTPFVVRQCVFGFLTSCLASGVCKDLFVAATAIVYTISLISSCIHIFIYYHRSSKFRAVLISLFGCSLVIEKSSKRKDNSAMSIKEIYSLSAH